MGNGEKPSTRSRWYAIVLVAMALTSASKSFGEDTVKIAIERLNRQVDLVDYIKPYIEREDLGRLLLLRTSTTRVLTSIKEKGPMHLQTLRDYQALILTYRYSKVYLKEISSENTDLAVKELGDITEFFAKEYGFDDSPYTHVTLNTFTQVHKLILQLLTISVTPALKKKLEDLKSPVGELMAIAKQGDDFKTFQEAIPRCKQLRALYVEFYKVAQSDAAYELTLEMQGLNEWYIERARIPL